MKLSPIFPWTMPGRNGSRLFPISHIYMFGPMPLVKLLRITPKFSAISYKGSEMWRVLVYCQWAIGTVLLIMSRLRQSRVSTPSFSVVSEYIKTIALFLLGAPPPPPRFLCVLLGGAPPSPAVTSKLSLLLLYSFSGLGSCLPLPHTSRNFCMHLFYTF